MKEIREFLDAMSEARSFADVNIAAGVALPMVSKIARRAVIILALTLLVTTAAFARGYARLDQRLERADERHRVMLTTMTRTNTKQQRVMAAKIVEAKKERDRLATEVSHLRSALGPALVAVAQSKRGTSQPENAVLVQPAAATASTPSTPQTALVEEAPPPPPPPPAAEPPPADPPGPQPPAAKPPVAEQPSPTPPTEPSPPPDPPEVPGAPETEPEPPLAGLGVP